MAQQDTLRNLLIAAMLFFGVMLIAPRILPTPRGPSPAAPAGPGEPRGQTGSTGDRVATGDATPDLDASTPTSERSGLTVMEARDPQTRTMGAGPTDGIYGSAGAPYRMRLTLSNVGASIESATMTDHARTIKNPDRYQLLSPVTQPDGGLLRSLAIEKITIDDAAVALDDKLWHVKDVETYSLQGEEGSIDGQQIEFRVEIHKNGVPIVGLTRTFRLPMQPRELGRHDLRSEVTVHNLDREPHRIVLTYRGGLGLPLDVNWRGERFIDFGVDDGAGRVLGTRKPFGEIAGQNVQSIPLYSFMPSAPDMRLSWAATGTRYFTCTIAPLDFDGKGRGSPVATVSAVDLDGDIATTDDVTIRLVTVVGAALDAGASRTYPADVYIGEKEGKAFRHVPEYQRRNYYFQIAQGFGWCTFTWLVEFMIWLLNSLHAGLRDFGLAIIILVLIVRTLLHPITKYGQINMVRMQQKMGEFTPKIEELKKKYGKDKARLQQETMKLYREHGVNPAGQILGCLPMFLQMPIWVALFLSLSNNIGMRHQPLHFTWIRDLTAQDALFTFSSPLPLIGASFNLLPLLVAVFMYLQQKLQPKPKPNPNMSDQQRQQQEMMQKMMPMMSIMMLIFFYKMPSGLNLYIMFSSLFGTLEQIRIRKLIKEREERGELHKAPRKGNASPAGRKPGKASFFERLQKMAEEAQKSQPRRQEKRGSRR